MPESRAEDERAGGAFAAAGLQDAEDGNGQRHGRRLVALADQVQDPVAAQGFRVVLDPDRGCLGGPQRVDAQQVGQGAVVDGDGLGDLQEPDQLEPVQALGAGLIGMDLGQSGVDGGVGRDQAVDVGEPEEPANRVHHRVHRRGHQPGLAQAADVQLDMGTLDPDQRVEAVGLAPVEPAPQLVGVKLVGVPGVPGQEGNGSQLRRGHRQRLEGQELRRRGHGSPHAAITKRPGRARRQHGEAVDGRRLVLWPATGRRRNDALVASKSEGRFGASGPSVADVDATLVDCCDQAARAHR